MGPVALHLLGKPTSIENGEKTWRYGRKGSLAVHVGGSEGLVGSWTDFESGDQGGVLDLIERERNCERRAALDWLRDQGLMIPSEDQRGRIGAPRSSRRTRASQAAPQRRSREPTPTPAGTDGDREATAYARQLWAKGVPADDTPGRIYLTERWVWPGLHVTGAPNLPAEVVRWLSRKTAARTVAPCTEKGLWLPKGAAGALMFAFTEADNVIAVQFEGLTADGERTPYTTRRQEMNRFRQFRGRVAGAYMLLRRAESKSLLILVEGPADALAAWWLWPNAAAVWSCAGTSGLAQVQPDHVTGFDTVALAADGDRAGQKAAWRTTVRLFEAGIPVKRWPSRRGADPVDSLAERLQERAAIVEFDGRLPRLEAEAVAWTPYL